MSEYVSWAVSSKKGFSSNTGNKTFKYLYIEWIVWPDSVEIHIKIKGVFKNLTYAFEIPLDQNKQGEK